ncbi:MAG: hypothetical protein LBL13_02635 [Bacteroidales bacterium]|jgi:hypothetical protein|nr:hypothetical protein [Bacteroidales bacterium]
MKRIVLIAIASLFLCSVSSFAQKNNNSKLKGTVSCKPKKSYSNLPPRGGRTEMPTGIEGHKINFGFSLGGSFAHIDALNKEKAFIGGRGTIFIHAIIPNTKTFAIGFEGGLTYLLANAAKYKETLVASTRNGALATSKEAQVTVGNWMLPTAQVSFVGNFHPIQRFNVQIKGNIGVVLAMVPRYNGEYYIKEIQSDGTYMENKYSFLYNDDFKVGFSATIGTKLLYAITNHVEFGVGIDWSYFRFSYDKGWLSPEAKVIPELTQFGVFDLHLGFAFSF